MPDAAPKKATAVAHPNIALVKYWGKADVERNLPAVGSLSITLDGMTTTTSVGFEAGLDADRFRLGGREEPQMAARVSACLDRFRRRTGVDGFAVVESDNDFPTAAGLASSASGFAALMVAADAAAATGLDRGQLADLARQASGSAARSIFGGFAEIALDGGSPDATARCRQLLPASEWPLRVVVAVTATKAKKTGSTAGMEQTRATSAFYPAWVETHPADLDLARSAVAARDFETLAEVSESSCLKMHAVMQSARPGLVYWNGATVEGIHRVRELRQEGVPVFFTIDAGPQLKAVCLPEAASRVREALAGLDGVDHLIESGLGEGARVVRE